MHERQAPRDSEASTMFSKLSKFRSAKLSRQNSPQGDHDSHDDDENSPNHNKFRISFNKPPTSQSVPLGAPPGAPLVHLVRKPSSLPLGRNTIPIPSVAPLIENYDSDSDDNVSFAECLFPITPPGEVRLGHRFSHESFDDLVLPPTEADVRTQLMKKFSLGHDIAIPLRKQMEMGRMSVDSGRRSVDLGLLRSVDLGRRSVDLGHQSVDLAKKMSWMSQDVDVFSDSSARKENFMESRRSSTWEASYRRVWVPPNGFDRTAATATTTRSWASTELEGVEIDTGHVEVLPPRDEAEDEFLEEFEEYFNNLQVDNVRRKQYPKLELQKIVYLDYANFSLFSNFQVEEHLKILLAQGPCLGSASFSSSSDNPLFKHVADTQNRLLRMLNTTASHYSIIFTAGFQESFRLVAESYPFQKGSPLLVCQDNHAAVRLVIQAAFRAGGKPFLAPLTENELCFHNHDLHKLLRLQANRNASSGGLFIYPAQSNLSGMKHSLSWVVEAQQSGWKVCLDTTTLLPTSALDLDIHQPDFVIGSFHHMVGYPSGMGFLLVRRESFCVRASRNAETVQFIRNKPADEGEHCHILCPADNTMNLLQFAALNVGLIQLERIGFAAIQKRVRALAIWLVQRLRTLKHKHGEQPYLLRVYGSHAAKDRGSIVAFNVIDPSGTVLPPDIIRKLAARSNIQLSVGNFQNPGLAYLLGGKPKVRSNNLAVFEDGDSEFTAVRASFGAVSNFADVYRLVQFLSRFRDEEYLASEAIGFVEERNLMLQ